MSIKIYVNINMVYLDTPVCEWHWRQLGLSDDLNIAIFHVPFPYNPNFQTQIDNAATAFDKVIVLCSELHDNSANFISNAQYPNVYYFTCGIINGVQSHLWMDWFITTTSVYKNTSLLSRLSPYSTKPKYFDALLGWAKPHRQLAYDYFKDNDNIILNYFQDRSKSLNEQGWVGHTIEDNIKNTITRVGYQNTQASLSQIIPFDVYNQTAYSIVAETNYSNDYSFYTEKIVKPILAERLFVVISGQHFLKNLRSLGFQTFDGIIDESYDSEPDLHKRFNLLTDQVNYLLAQPQSYILEQIKPIVAHNKNHMMNNDWLSETQSTIKNSLSK